MIGKVSGQNCLFHQIDNLTIFVGRQTSEDVITLHYNNATNLIMTSKIKVTTIQERYKIVVMLDLCKSIGDIKTDQCGWVDHDSYPIPLVHQDPVTRYTLRFCSNILLLCLCPLAKSFWKSRSNFFSYMACVSADGPQDPGSITVNLC